MPSTSVRGESAGCGSVDVAGVVFVDLAGLVPGVIGVVVEVVVPEGTDVPVARLGVPEFCVVELDGLVADGLVVSGLVVSGLVVSGLVVCGLVELVDFDRFLDHIHCLPSIVFGGFREGFGRAVDAGPPLVGLVLATELLERGRVSTVERRRPAVGGRGVELWNLQLAQRGCGIPEVQTCSGHRDREFDLHRRLEGGAVDGPSELEGTFRAPEPTLTVDHHRELVVAAGDPPVGAEFPERRGEVTETVRRDRGSLTDHSHAAGSACSAQRVLVRFLRIGVDEERRGDEVSRDPVHVVLAEGLELSTSGGVEVTGIDLVRDLGVVVTRADRTGAVRVPVFPVVPSGLAEAGAGRAVTVAEPLPIGSTVAGGAVVIATERTVIAAATNGPISVTAGTVIVAAEGPVTITTGTVIVPTERTVVAATANGPVAITAGAIVVPTERPVTITTGTVIVPTERPVTITTRTVIVPTERTVTITTRTVSCGPVRSPRRTVVPGSTFAEFTAGRPSVRAVAARTIPTRGPTTSTPTFTSFEVTRPRRPTTAVAFASRSIRTVSVTPVSPLFVVVRHRSSSLRAEDSCLGDRPLCRCVVLWQPKQPVLVQSIMNRAQSRPHASEMKQKMATGPHESCCSRWRADGHIIEKKSGGVLLSHKVPLAVPSALRGLASGFGM